MTASDPRVGEIQARSDEALLHESLNPSDYAELAWASARDVAYLLAELRDRDEKLAKAWDEGHQAGWNDRDDDAQSGWVPSGYAADTPNPYRAAVAAAGGGGE